MSAESVLMNFSVGYKIPSLIDEVTEEHSDPLSGSAGEPRDLNPIKSTGGAQHGYHGLR
jgi:hypothetical protein